MGPLRVHVDAGSWSIDQIPAKHLCLHMTTQLLRHLRDFEAFLGTVAARLGACGHVLVIWHCFAGSGAILTALRTAQRGMGREIALPSAQRRAHLATVCAVHAQMHTLGMLLFSIRDE